MKLLTPTEVASAREGDMKRDRARTDATKNALRTVETELNDAEAKFEATLARQRAIWAKSEEDAMTKITSLKNEIETLTRARDEASIPIAEKEKKAHNLFIEADHVLENALKMRADLELKERDIEITTTLLQERLDDVANRESDVLLKEKQLKVREQNINDERNMIKKLSNELSIKLTSL